jgi:uncharacterized protein YjbI with pentapeptide repeats
MHVHPLAATHACGVQVGYTSKGADVNDGLCPLHSHDPDKEQDTLRRHLIDCDRHGEYSCYGWVIPFDLTLDHRNLSRVCFSHAVFLGETHFEDSRFLPSYSGDVTQARANFQGAVFESSAFFSRAVFDVLADFDDAQFPKYGNFEGVQFRLGGHFRRAKFATGSTFAGAETSLLPLDFGFSAAERIHPDGASAIGPFPCIWSSPIIGYSRLCGKPRAELLPGGSASHARDLMCAGHSRDSSKNPDETQKQFSDLQKNLACAEWVFNYPVQLAGREIASVDFRNARFQRTVDLERTSFDDRALFGGAYFASGVSFEGANFKSGADFADTSFPLGVGFRSTAFGAPTTFLRTYFGADSGFGGASLEKVTFRQCALGNIVLSEAYAIAKAEFDEVIWTTPPPPGDVAKYDDAWRASAIRSGWTGNSGVREERTARATNTRSDFAAAEKVYREIRRSLEDHRHFRLASRIGARELEMRRLALGAADSQQDAKRRNPWRWVRANWLSLEAWYRRFSDYGESTWKPLAWLGAVLVLAPWALAACSLQIAGQQYVLAYPFAPGTNARQAYLDLLTFAFRTTALLPEPALTQFNTGSQTLQILLRVAGPFFALLYTLAVQRRFQR